MRTIATKTTVGLRFTDALQVTVTGPRGGTHAVFYLSAADALRLSDELEAAAHELLGETNGKGA